MRKSLYDEGYAIARDHVDGLLKNKSLVPTKVFAFALALQQVLTPFAQNTFSVVLSPFGFDFHKMLMVDLLHEVELGVWKALLMHLIWMLHTYGADKIHEFDEWYALLSIYMLE